MTDFWSTELEGPEPRCVEEEYLWEAMEVQRHRLMEMSTVLDQQTKLLRLIMQVLYCLGDTYLTFGLGKLWTWVCQPYYGVGAPKYLCLHTVSS